MKKLFLLFTLLLSSLTYADFISSKTSQVFHELDCRYTTSLNEGNSFTYSTYQEAIDAGLRPCGICEPQPDSEPDPDPDPDPNEPEVLPPKQPSVVIPINGVVLQMDYCRFPYTARGVGKPIKVVEEIPITLKEAKAQGFQPCLNYSQIMQPTFPDDEPKDKIDPNSYAVDEYGRSEYYWHSYFYNIMTVFNYNQIPEGRVALLSEEQIEVLELIDFIYKEVKDGKELSEISYYYDFLRAEPHNMLKFLKVYVDQTISTGKFVYGTMIELEEYEIPEITLYQQILEGWILKIERDFPDIVDNDTISFQPPPEISIEDPNSESQIVYITNISNYYHPKDCIHFGGIEIKMVNRETSVLAGNNATWYPESGIMAWRVTPFEVGDYIAIADSDVGQTELMAITVRPYRIPDIEDFAKSWLKGNFNLLKYGEWLGFRSNLPPRNPTYNNEISWVYEDGRWIPYSHSRVIIQEEQEIINEITTKKRTTKIYEEPLSEYSVVWQTVKKEITEVTVIDYIREGNPQPKSLMTKSLSDKDIEWIFQDGQWKPIIRETEKNPYLDEHGFPDEESLNLSKPIPPIKPDPDFVSEEVKELEALKSIAGELSPVIDQLIKQSSPQESYEDQLIKYGAEYAKYEKDLEMWERTMEMIEQEKQLMIEEELHEVERSERWVEEELLMQDEDKMQIIRDLIQDDRISEGQKGVLREILEVIKETPVLDHIDP